MGLTQGKNYREAGGDSLRIGGELDIISGGKLLFAGVELVPGALADLTTTEQGSLVGAINEVDGHADDALEAIGTIGDLETTATDLVGAINEVKAVADAALATPAANQAAITDPETATAAAVATALNTLLGALKTAGLMVADS